LIFFHLHSSFTFFMAAAAAKWAQCKGEGSGGMGMDLIGAASKVGDDMGGLGSGGKMADLMA
jgi:hypothetical protein